MTEVEFIQIFKEHKQYWNLKRQVIRTLKNNKLHRADYEKS